uniref:Uncharacterized protein n=1 Tax=Sphaerodactylus townsendi TaxID=933632 RepID=A0ACB8ENP7_9SAUR
MKAPVPVVSPSSLVNQSKAKELVRANLSILQHHAKTAAIRESQQVAFNSETLDTLPKLYTNREEQVVLRLECRGSSGKPCQGAALVTIQFEGKYKNEAVGQQLHALKKEVKLLQAEATKPPSLGVVEAAVHLENFITALINLYKSQPVPGIHRVGISLFFAVAGFVSDETQRHPPTRQFFSSCIEILGQVFVAGSKSECRPLLQTILKNRRLCNLLSPYFTPVASPDEFVDLYEQVVLFLSDDNSDVIFMLLTKFDLPQWLQSSKPSLSERTRLLESVHLALKTCGFEPEEDISMPFNLFCKHWTCLLRYQFPDHYSSFLQLLMQSSSDQLLCPDCWKASLKALGCSRKAPKKDGREEAATERAALSTSAETLLSTEQVVETVEWLSKFFLRLRLSSRDFQTFGLFSKWAPYIAQVKRFMEYLVNRLVDSEAASLAQEPVGSGDILAALQSLHSVVTQLFAPWIQVLQQEDASKQPCYPWLESDAPAASQMVRLFADSIGVLHESFKDKLLPGHQGTLWLHLMHYCQTCTAPKMPEHILYTLHTEFARLPWKEMHPDQQLMEEFFKVPPGVWLNPTPCALPSARDKGWKRQPEKAVSLFPGAPSCREVNWVAIPLTSAWHAHPASEETLASMIVCLLYAWWSTAGKGAAAGNQRATTHRPSSVAKRPLKLSSITVKLLKEWLPALAPLPATSCTLAAQPLRVRALVQPDPSTSSSVPGTKSGKISLSVLEQERCKLLRWRHPLPTAPPDPGVQARIPGIKQPLPRGPDDAKQRQRLRRRSLRGLEAAHRRRLPAGVPFLGELPDLYSSSRCSVELPSRPWPTMRGAADSEQQWLEGGLFPRMRSFQKCFFGGRKSSSSASSKPERFRVVARSMSAFLLVQIPVENQIRLRPGTELQLSAKAQQALQALDSLASNKHYAVYQEQISQASLFIKDPEHCLGHGSNLLAILLNTLYPEVHYLDGIR